MTKFAYRQEVRSKPCPYAGFEKFWCEIAGIVVDIEEEADTTFYTVHDHKSQGFYVLAEDSLEPLPRHTEAPFKQPALCAGPAGESAPVSGSP